jgi:hypothetical protein
MLSSRGKHAALFEQRASAAVNKGRYYHDGRFATLLDVVNQYNTRFSLGLTAQEKLDLVEYFEIAAGGGVSS